MQVLVMYYTRTDNTKKLAEAIAKGVEEVDGVKCVLKIAADVTEDDFLNSDGIIAGSPVYFGSMAAELKKVFDKFVGVRRKMEDKIGAAFGSYGWSGEAVKLINKELEAMKFELIDPGLRIQYVPDDQGIEASYQLGRKIAQRLPG